MDIGIKERNQMANLNNVNLLGRMVRDPEIRTTQSGKQVCSFTLAVDKRGKDAGANFFDCTAWEQSADFLSKYGQKGAQVLVSGRLDQQVWEKDNKKQSKVAIIADEVQLLSSVQEKSNGAESAQIDENINLDKIPF